MFAVGIYSIVNLQRFGDLTGNTYVAGAAIFIFAGIFKFVFGLLGILVMFWQKKPLMMIVSFFCLFVSLFVFVWVFLSFSQLVGAGEEGC